MDGDFINACVYLRRVEGIEDLPADVQLLELVHAQTYAAIVTAEQALEQTDLLKKQNEMLRELLQSSALEVHGV